MKIRKLLFAATLALSAGLSFAQTSPSGGSGPMGGMGGPGGMGARMSPEERDKLCQANPEKCARIKEEMSKRREMHEACQSDPNSEKCKGMRQQQHEQHEKLRDEMKKKCEADPKTCEAKKEQFRERMEERRERMDERRERNQERRERWQERGDKPASGSK